MQKDLEYLIKLLNDFHSHHEEVKSEQVPELIESLKQRLDSLNHLYSIEAQKHLTSDQKDVLDALEHASKTYPLLSDFIHSSVKNKMDEESKGNEQGGQDSASGGSRLAKYILAPMKNVLWRVKRITFFR